MHHFDRYAYESGLRNQDALEKLIFTITTLLVCIWANEPLISIGILVLMSGITVFYGSIPFLTLLKLFSLPLSFLMLSILAIIFNITAGKEGLIFSISIKEIYVGVSRVGLITGINLFLKAMGAVSCLYYLVLTTPLIDFLSALSRIRVPSLMVQLMGLIYRFIFVFIETAQVMYTAQKSRLGYQGFKGSYGAMGTLIANLFVRSYKKSEALYTGLEARGFEGQLNVLEETDHQWKKGYTYMVIINGFFISCRVLLRVLEKR